MNKKSLRYIAGIINMLESNMLDLNNNMLDVLNLTDEERRRVEDAIQVTMEKIYQIKQSKIQDLHEHIEIDLVERNTL